MSYDLKSKFVSIVSVLLLATVLPGSALASDRTSELNPVAIISGQETPVAVGTVVGDGTMTDGQTCSFSPMRVGGRGGLDTPPSEIVMRVTEDCRMVVDEIKINPTSLAAQQQARGVAAMEPVRSGPVGTLARIIHQVVRR